MTPDDAMHWAWALLIGACAVFVASWPIGRAVQWAAEQVYNWRDRRRLERMRASKEREELRQKGWKQE